MATPATAVVACGYGADGQLGSASAARCRRVARLLPVIPELAWPPLAVAWGSTVDQTGLAFGAPAPPPPPNGVRVERLCLADGGAVQCDIDGVLWLRRRTLQGWWGPDAERLSGPWDAPDAIIRAMATTASVLHVLWEGGGSSGGLALIRLAQSAEEATGTDRTPGPTAETHDAATSDSAHQDEDSTVVRPAAALTPQIVTLPPALQRAMLRHVQQLACGKTHAALLDAAGAVWTFGAGNHGQLGHGDISAQATPRPVEALLGLQVVAITCGGWHTLALTSAGDGYSCGWNRHGQLGRIVPAASGMGEDDDDDRGEPSCVMALVDVGDEVHLVAVAAGSAHSAAVDRTGVLYTWGWGKYGQLGFEHAPAHSRNDALPADDIWDAPLPQAVHGIKGRAVVSGHSSWATYVLLA